MASEEQILEKRVRQVVHLLKVGDFDALEAQTDGARLTAAELELALREYGRRLDDPPDGWWRDYVDVVRSNAGEVLVDAPLWTQEEGRSDLTLQLRFAGEPGSEAVEIDGLHVL